MFKHDFLILLRTINSLCRCRTTDTSSAINHVDCYASMIPSEACDKITRRHVTNQARNYEQSVFKTINEQLEHWYRVSVRSFVFSQPAKSASTALAEPAISQPVSQRNALQTKERTLQSKDKTPTKERLFHAKDKTLTKEKTFETEEKTIQTKDRTPTKERTLQTKEETPTNK